jgi:hypothetical protein
VAVGIDVGVRPQYRGLSGRNRVWQRDSGTTAGLADLMPGPAEPAIDGEGPLARGASGNRDRGLRTRIA